MSNNGFLPINREEMRQRGWNSVDFVYVIGDAYVDHPSFGHAIISRVLEAHGYRVAILPQPDWKNEEEIQKFGRPRLGFLVSGGKITLQLFIVIIFGVFIKTVPLLLAELKRVFDEWLIMIIGRIN